MNLGLNPESSSQLPGQPNKVVRAYIFYRYSLLTHSSIYL